MRAINHALEHLSHTPGSCFQDMLNRISAGMWHLTTSLCSNEPLWVGSLLSTVAKGISALSVTEDEDVALLNPVFIQFTRKGLKVLLLLFQQ